MLVLLALLLIQWIRLRSNDCVIPRDHIHLVVVVCLGYFSFFLFFLLKLLFLLCFFYILHLHYPDYFGAIPVII